MKIKLQFMTAAFAALMIFVPIAHGQARLTFSGGSGTPLSTTILTPITYTVNNANCGINNGHFFIFAEAGNPFAVFFTVTGTISFTANGGEAQPITVEGSGGSATNITPNDIFVYGNRLGAANGSTVILSAGTVTTNNNAAAARPANGTFTTFLTDGNGVRCSTNGVSAAPPTTAAVVSVYGRVLTGSGRGIANAIVQFTD
jgi:hypothetical protein